MASYRNIGNPAPKSDLPLILIVEDNQAMNDFLRELLSKEYRTESAFDGEEGLEKADLLRPDLIITDIMMPRMTGDRMFHALRAKPPLSEIPVIVLSATDDASLRMRLLREGAEDYIAKPFIIEEVLSRVRNLLRLRQVATENAELYAEASAAVKLREEILGIVSHDLRTPLTALQLRFHLISKLAEKSPDREKLKTHLLASERAARQMGRMIGDLLDFAKIQSGTLSLEEAECDVLLLIEEGAKLLRHLADQKNITIACEVEPDLPSANCDINRIFQVISNLLGNAIKFSPEKSEIRMSARKRGSEIQFSVSDQGPGVPRENLERIFEKFWQAPETARLGNGLGLSIAKGIISGHHGRIWAESVVGAGTTFHFTLPIAKEGRKNEGAVKSPSASAH